MKRPELRWMAEGPPDAAEEIIKGGPLDSNKKRAFDDKWISAHDARVKVSKAAGSRIEAQTLLCEAMIGGTIGTRGVPSDADHRGALQAAFGLSDSDDFQRIRISATFWAAASDEDQRQWNWPAGEFCSTLADSTKPERYFGVEFMAFEVDALCADNGLTVAMASNGERSSTARKKGQGGRPSGNHGEPIAQMTLKLFTMDKKLLGRYTGEALVPDLAAAYENADLDAPADYSLLGFSRGILKVVKKARRESE